MKRTVFLGLYAGLFFCILALPNHPSQFAWSALTRWPIELSVLLFLMLAVGRLRGVATAVAAMLVAVTLLKLADLASFWVYDRRFNPVSDLFLIEAGIGLLSDSIGVVGAWVVVIAGFIVTVGLFFVMRAGLKAWGRFDMPGPARATAFAGVLATTGWAVADTGHHLKYWEFETSPPGTARTSRIAFERVGQAGETVVDLARFKREAREDPLRDISGVFDRLQGRDVLLIWIESYGRASFDNSDYAATHGETLRAAQSAIESTGMAMKSGWLTSPTSGGQSWLAHGALASGLWTSDNARYRAMIASGQKWLFHYAQKAGYRTSAVMPAITVAWPESAAMGFDLVFEAKDIPYKGEAFNWVTMPDQYTLASYRALLQPDERPDFIQIALISSHAPWTPVPDMLPWEEIGDGTEFNAMAARGPTPRELWKNRDDVRDAYRRSVDYSLQAVFSHVARLGDEAPLVIVAGDHQAAGFVAGSENKDVPIHMIGPPEILALIDHWGWSDGLFPAPGSPVRRMNSFREDFIKAFSSMRHVAERSR